mgnify:CR=1 FL=1
MEMPFPELISKLAVSPLFIVVVLVAILNVILNRKAEIENVSNQIIPNKSIIQSHKTSSNGTINSNDTSSSS